VRHTRIRLTNFVSHIDTIINLEQVNACVCIGPNGAGKSSAMVDSFLLAVFGKDGRKDDRTVRDGRLCPDRSERPSCLRINDHRT